MLFWWTVLAFAGLLSIVAAMVVGAVWRQMARAMGWRWVVEDAIAGALLGLGIAFLAAPFALHRLVHGDPERYRWLLQGPAPFGLLGGGPFQLAAYSGLWLAGVMLVCAGVLLRWRTWSRGPGGPLSL